MASPEEASSRASRYVSDYAAETGLEIDFDDPTAGDTTRTALVDLLVDLRHLADNQGIDFHAALDSSYMHYIAEKQGED